MNEMWMVPTYRGRVWPYVQQPKIGDGIRYMDDGFDVYVAEVRTRYLLFTDGTVMRKRLTWDSITSWIVRYNYARNVLSWRAARKRRQTWVQAGTVVQIG